MENPLQIEKNEANSAGGEHQPSVDEIPKESRKQCYSNEPILTENARAHVLETNAPADAPYVVRQAEYDNEYQEAYKDWVGSLSAEERKHLNDHALDEPNVGYSATGAPKGDLADSPLASYEPDIAAAIDGNDEVHVRKFASPDVLEAIRQLMAILISHSNIRLTVECLSLVLELRSYDGSSMTQIGRRYGITAAAVSKRCVGLTEELSIRPSRAMQTLIARESHRMARLNSIREQQQ